MSRLSRLLVLLLVLLVVALGSAVAAMEMAIRSAEVAVPDFKGLTLAESSHHASTADLGVKVDHRAYSATIPAGKVASQSPAAGTLVGRDSEIRVVESLGARHGSVPDVLGQPEQTAVLQLRREGIDVPHIARVPDWGHAPGTVMAQSPEGDEDGEPSMALLVSEPAEVAEGGFVMPDFVGQEAEKAQAAIVGAGLKVKVTLASTGGKAGTVIRQTPAAGSRVDSKMAGELTVSR